MGRTSLVLTMGEPSGIAPEITIKAWRDRNKAGLPSFFVLGDPSLYADAPVTEIRAPEEAAAVFDTALPVLPVRLEKPVVTGVPDASHAAAVIESIDRAARFCRDGRARAVVTNPIQKSSLQQSGLFVFPGHTEYLAHLDGGAAEPVMMLAAKDLRVVPLTIHIALKDVPAAITKESICCTVRTLHKALKKDFGISAPRIAVAGLNPHAGEGGAFGREEIETITPALGILRMEGIAVSGPHAADTLFHEEARAKYDAALCMYHDQALIPLKTLDFHGGVNVTLGLGFIRTSPDHGTALGIAGQGVANHQSLVQALLLADTLAKKRG